MKRHKAKLLRFILVALAACSSTSASYEILASESEICIADELSVTSLQGQVKSIRDTKPLSQAGVILKEFRDDEWRKISELRVDESGRFVFPNIKPGRYLLEARSYGYEYTSAYVRLKKFSKNKVSRDEMIFWLRMPLEKCGYVQLQRQK